MSRSKPRPVVAKLHELTPGQSADFFALLAERTKATTRDGKPYYACRFRDNKRAVECRVWADHPLFGDCDQHWTAGGFYKVRGAYQEHER